MAAAALPVLLLTVSGCTMDFASMSPDMTAIRQAHTEGHGAEPQSDRQADREVEPTSELASGSATHVRRTPEMSVVLSYWTESADDIRRGRSAAVSLSVDVQRSSAGAGEVKITHIELLGDRGEPVLDDTGEFVVTPPYSYQTEFMTPSSTKTEQELRARVDFLVETEPRSGTFFRRTVIDTLRLTSAGV